MHVAQIEHKHNTSWFIRNKLHCVPSTWQRIKIYHACKGEQCGLDLSHVSIFKEVIGFKDVIGLQAIG